MSAAKRARPSEMKPADAARIIQRAWRAHRARKGAPRSKATWALAGEELKFIDYGYAAAIPAPTDSTGGEADPATALALNSIAQGDGPSDRDGRKVNVKSVYVTGNVVFSGNADETDTPSAPVIYIALVMDRQTNGAQLNSEDVFTNPAANALTAANPVRDLAFSKRFQVCDVARLDDFETIAFPDGASTGSVNCSSKAFSLSWSGNVVTNYVAATAVVASIADVSFHVIAFASSVTFAPSLVYNSRVRFTG
jgi:hypothetical protein